MSSRPSPFWAWSALVLWVLCSVCCEPPAVAQVPPVISLQGRVTVGGVPFDGAGRFKFALLALRGDPAMTVSVWSHDGTGIGTLDEPASVVTLPVNRGLYSVLLGDTSLPNMSEPLTSAVLTNLDVRLRVWFDDAVHGIQVLTPDQKLASVGYAMMADRADKAKVAESVDVDPTFRGQSTFNGNVVVGVITATERLNVGGNIRVIDDGGIFGLNSIVGFNDLWIYGDPVGGPDVYIGSDGKVGMGTTLLNSQVNIVGPDNNGQVAGLQVISGVQRLLLDGNEIDSNGTLHLNLNGPHDVTLAGGGGRVTIGSISPDERLNIDGHIRLANDGDIRGLDDLVGFDGLKLWGSAGGSADLVISSGGNIGHRVSYGNVSFNIRGDIFAGETQVLRVEDNFGLSILEVQADRDVFVVGDFNVNSGTKNFVIDHPQAPEEMALRHNTVEGPGYYTFYHGRVRLDARGEAWVELPDYFDALNTSPHYQLTCVGGYAPVYVAEEASGNRFKIGGGNAGLQVCWQITAVRNDAFARDHPYQAEIAKSAEERGRYYYPEGYGATAAQSLQRHPHAQGTTPALPSTR